MESSKRRSTGCMEMRETMIRDMTLGQYYPVDSFIHKLDPRTKLFGTMVYIISLFLADGIVGYLISAVFLAIVIRVSKVPFKFIVIGYRHDGSKFFFGKSGRMNSFQRAASAIVCLSVHGMYRLKLLASEPPPTMERPLYPLRFY